MEPAKCTNSEITAAVTKEVKSQGQELNKITKFKCADGWAVATAGVGTPPAWVQTQFIFQAEGQFWVPVKQKDACLMGSPLPDALRKLACSNVVG